MREGKNNMRRWLLSGLGLLSMWPLCLSAGEEPPAVAIERAPTPVVVQPQVEPPPAPQIVEPKAVVVAAPFPAYKVKYEVNYNGIKVGEMTQQLSARSNGRQTLQTVAYTTGLVSWLKSDKITERSIWHDSNGTLSPLSYTYRYSGNNKEAFERLDFDWQTGVVKSLRDGKVTELAVEAGTFDKHMYQLLLRRDLAKGLRQLSYPVADRGKLEQYEFEVLAEELVETETLGKINCLKLKKGTTFIWVAQKFDYLPVKIEKDEDGSMVSSELIEFNRR